MRARFTIVAIALACGSSASAQFSLTTGYSGTQTTYIATSPAMYFDLTALNSAGITVTSFDSTSGASAGTNIRVNIYVKQGSYIGFEALPMAWTFIGEVIVPSAGAGVGTPIPIGDLYIPPNETWGIRIGHVNGNLRYRSGAVFIPMHANDDARMDLGSAQANFFSGTATAGRGWIGTIYYDIGNTVVYGACCFPSGACDTLTANVCAGQGGTYQGANTQCSGTCPQPPLGACCLNDGSCTQVWVGECTTLQGIYSGDNTLCASTSCPRWVPTADQNNGLSGANAGVFFDLIAADTVTVNRLDYFAMSTAGTATTLQLWTYPGTYQGRDTDPTGWVLHDTINTVSAGNTVLAPANLNNPLVIETGQTVGVYLIAQTGGIRYTGTTTSSPQTYWSTNDLALFGERARTLPWAGTLNSPRTFAGRIYYSMGAVAPCYANCDGSTVAPILNVEDFTCFINAFASAQALSHQQQLTHYANCDQSTTAPVLNVEDFTCFINKFAQGCR
jgi:hypothetical protein